MNILHLQLSGDPGGIVTLCKAISDNSENTNYMYFLFEGGRIADSILNDGGKIYIADANRKYWRKDIQKFFTYIKKSNIDVIVNHTNCPIACAHLIAAKKEFPHIKFIMYLHGAAEDMLPRNPLKEWVYKWYIKREVKSVNFIVAISEYVKHSCMDSFSINANKLVVIYNGVDTTKFSCNIGRKPHQKMELLYVGRIIENKGIHILIQAMALLVKEIPVHLTIVGDGSYMDEVKYLIKRLNLEDAVDLLGVRLDIPKIMRSADYFIHPAIWNEGFGITLIEAMASGLPCIASARGAIPEIVKDGENGFLLHDVLPEGIAKQINYCYGILSTRKYEELVKNACNTANKFNIKNMVDKLEKLYLRK